MITKTRVHACTTSDTYRVFNSLTSDSAHLESTSPSQIASATQVAVTICTYNERENLEQLMSAIRNVVPEATLVILDDNSPDGTGEIADWWAADDGKTKVIHRVGERGLGSATLKAFQHVIDSDFDLVVNLDADMSHNPESIPNLLAPLIEGQADVVIGSRYVPDGKIEGWPLKRHVMSRAINIWSRAWLGLKTRDCSGAFRAYRCDLLRKIDFSEFRSEGYAMQEEMLYRCARAGARIVEVPIHFVDRIVGASKINMKEAFKAVWIIARCGCEGNPTKKSAES